MEKGTLTAAEKRAYQKRILALLIEVNKISLRFIQRISSSSLSEEDSQDFLSIAEDFQRKTFKLLHRSSTFIDDMTAEEIEKEMEEISSQNKELSEKVEEWAKLLDELSKRKKEG